MHLSLVSEEYDYWSHTTSHHYMVDRNQEIILKGDKMKLDLLQSEFEKHCDYYLNLCDGDVNEAIDNLRVHIYSDMSASCFNLIQKILNERSSISDKFSENLKYIEEYFAVKNG